MADAASAAPTPPSAGRGRRAARYIAERRSTAVVLVVLLAGTLVGTWAVHTVIRDQQTRLLVERTSEIAAVIDSASVTTRTQLADLAADALTEGPSGARFQSDAAAATATGANVGVAQLRGGTLQVIASRASTTPTTTTTPTTNAPPSSEVVDRALAAKDFVSQLSRNSTGSQLVIVMKVAAPEPTIVYLTRSLVPNRPAPTTSSSPYRELDVAIYAASRPDPAELLLVSGASPAGKHPSSAKTFAFGADTWVLVAAPRQPLVGSFAQTFPWLVLGGGLLATVLTVLMMDVLSRRRAYALRLVEERTRTLREAQEAAEVANRAKSEFISRMSHELRTPLNAVLGFGQVLELFEDLTEQQHNAVKHITTGGRHLLDLINEILDISQVESGRLSLSPEPVLVGDLVSEATELLAPVAAENSVQLIVADADAKDLQRYVFADHQRMKQVMLNVVGNAIKYNRPGGLVTISCDEQVAGRLRIMVSDTGLGIGPSQLPLLFTPFERLGAERTSIEGTGMGLALSKHLVEAMNGTMGVESEVGKGSTFWVELPIVEGPVDRYHRLDKPKRTKPTELPTLLHIEDNLSNIKLVEQVLTKRPSVRLLAAMQGSVGLQLAREHRPSLILLDVNLPDIPGERVLASLRDDPRTARIPVVIVSADATQRQVQRLLSSGASQYLTKPIDVEELLRFIDAAVADLVPMGSGSPTN